MLGDMMKYRDTIQKYTDTHIYLYIYIYTQRISPSSYITHAVNNFHNTVFILYTEFVSNDQRTTILLLYQLQQQ